MNVRIEYDKLKRQYELLIDNKQTGLITERGLADDAYAAQLLRGLLKLAYKEND